MSEEPQPAVLESEPEIATPPSDAQLERELRVVSSEPHQHRSGVGYTATLALAALGVVYGDIGTSPLYAVRESLHHGHGVVVSAANVTGVISLIFWSLIMVICIKYLFMVLRADHHGEGGILALTALVGGTSAGGPRKLVLLTTLGLFGTALLFGDGMITPAISVLSAVEGLEFILPQSQPYILPITILILAVLFGVQSHGTATVGKIFGPMVLIWFATLTALGLYEVIQEPAILGALSPHHGFTFFLRNGWHGFLVLGSVFLVVTGGEALYADMGHFGRKPIQLAWFGIAFPALMMNYLGQGALLLRNPEAISNPFFLMGPRWALTWVVAIATLATVIASQALISGVFSLSMQAVQLGYLPRLEILHTSASERGQIYVPSLNWLLMVCCVGLVVGFGSSTNLAAAYGVAVTATMLITTVLFCCLLIYGWKWPVYLAGSVCGVFLLIEMVFFAANVVKIPEGGWFPLLTGWAIFIVMSTWKIGRNLLYRLLQGRTIPLEKLLDRLKEEPVNRIPGTAIFMYGNRTGTPPALLANLDHNGILHERVVLVAVETADVPTLLESERVEVIPIAEGFFRIVVRFGFIEKPELPSVLHNLDLGGVPLRVHESTFFLGRETVIPRKDRLSGMSHWREQLFAIMTRNATDATSFFALPPDRVVELGTQLEI
jgi:KUP system potassium uptake protein